MSSNISFNVLAQNLYLFILFHLFPYKNSSNIIKKDSSRLQIAMITKRYLLNLCLLNLKSF